MKRMLVMLAVSALLVLVLSVPAFAEVGKRQAYCGLTGQATVATEFEPGEVGAGTSEGAIAQSPGNLLLADPVSSFASSCNQSG